MAQEKSEIHQNPPTSGDDEDDIEGKSKKQKFRPPTVTRITRPTTGASVDDHLMSTGAITLSMTKQTSSTYMSNTNIDLINSTHHNGLDRSDSLSNSLVTSTAHLMHKSDPFDQEFSAKNQQDQAKMKDIKSHGSIKINQRAK